MKTSTKMSLILFFICSFSVLVSTVPNLANSQTSEPLVIEFSPEMVSGANFTWIVNEWVNMGEWLKDDSPYIPSEGDLWEMQILQKPPSLQLDGLVSWNISDWSINDLDGSLDIRDSFEYKLSEYDFDVVFGQNWNLVMQLFLIPHQVNDTRFPDFYESLLIDAGANFKIESSGSSVRIEGNITTGNFQEDSFEFEATLGVVEKFVYKKKPFGQQLWTDSVNISIVKSEFPDPPIGNFAPEIAPGSKFTWEVNEWENMDEILNPGINYVPESGDQWTIEILKPIPSIPIPWSCDWDILGWHIEDFEFPTFPSKNESQMQFDIDGNSFLEVFGNESDDGESWKKFLFLFLLPNTVEDNTDEEKPFGQFMPATFAGIEINVTVEVAEVDGVRLEGSIGGEYEHSEIILEARLGIVESFTYRKRSPASQEWSSILNISLIESYIPEQKPEISGYSFVLGFCFLNVGIITVVVYRRIKKNMKS